MRGVPEDRAKRHLHAAFEFLRSQPSVNKNRIGAIGRCMGGGYSLDVALDEPALAAAIINYGHLATGPATLKKSLRFLDCSADRIAASHPMTSTNSRGHEATRQGKKIEIKIYDDAGHALENPNNPDGYRPADAADAWKRTISFLAENSKK